MFQLTSRHWFAIVFPVILAGRISACQVTGKQDAIELIGSLEMQNADVQQIQTAAHHGHAFVYLSDAGKRSVTVVDVTDAAHPAITRKLTMPQNSGSEESAQEECGSETRFSNATAVLTDHRRDLVYVAGQSGLKILRKKETLDPQVEREYTKHVLYDR